MASEQDLIPSMKDKDLKKKKKSLRTNNKKEKIYGYALVAPALILILGISIWPVIQSFYFSLFDLRLTDPTKSSVHLEYNLNLEEYLNSYPFLMSNIDQEISNGGKGAGELTQIKQKLNQLDQTIKKEPGAAEKYKEVNDLLFAYKPVSADISLVKINKETAAQYKKTIAQVVDDLKQINSNYKLKNGKQIVGLANSLEDAIIKPNFVGLSQYKNLLSDSETWHALGHTVTFTVISVTVELVLGLGIALLINKAFFGRGLVRAAILIPWAVPTVVSALMWKFMYDGQNGIFALIFAKIGLINSMSDLLSSPAGAMFSTIFADVWKTTPYMALLLLAGLQTIPGSLYEAASIDGAGKWKQFINITLPLLKTSFLVALLFRTLDAFRVFDLIYVLTGGGPANSTEVISLMAYKVMIGQTNFGSGSALAVIVFICVAIISIIFIKFLGRDLLGEEKAR
jgi:multiple sugar transport system permease protein